MSKLPLYRYIIIDDNETFYFIAPLLQQAGKELLLYDLNVIIRISKIDFTKQEVYCYTIGTIEQEKTSLINLPS